MKKFAALALLSPILSIAGSNSYHCVVQQQVTVSNDGTAVISSNNLLIDKQLSINRKTGEKVGNAVGHVHEKGSVRVLAEGNSANSFVATWIGPSAGEGVHLDVLRVEEFQPSVKKPFMALAGGVLYVGLCE